MCWASLRAGNTEARSTDVLRTLQEPQSGIQPSNRGEREREDCRTTVRAQVEVVEAPQVVLRKKGENFNIPFPK